MTVKTAEIGVNDRELKDKLRKLWSLGDYPRVTREIIPQLGHELTAACEIGPTSASWTLRPGRAMRPFRRPWPVPT